MKKILITGVNSYIGTSFENYIKSYYYENYIVDSMDMIDGGWSQKSFLGYDSIFHVAGIAHSDSGKINKDKAKAYYTVNTDLPIKVATKAKAEGVKQFIFMSSAIVYGNSAPIGKNKLVTKNTPVNPANAYGDSKVQAENGLSLLNDDGFKVVILRSPMVYGKGSKGNYSLLAKIALKSPIFPYVKNERSMLYIDNLCEFVHLMIKNNEQGTFWPQNSEYSNTSQVVKMIAASHNKKIWLSKGFTWFLKFISCFTELVNKAFGNLSYDMNMSEYKIDYRIYDLITSIEKTETDSNVLTDNK